MLRLTGNKDPYFFWMAVSVSACPVVIKIPTRPHLTTGDTALVFSILSIFGTFFFFLLPLSPSPEDHTLLGLPT